MVGKRDRCWRTDGERSVISMLEREKDGWKHWNRLWRPPVLTLLQILQTGLLSFQDGAHTTQSGSLQLFTPVQRVSVLHQTHIVFGNTVGGYIMSNSCWCCFSSSFCLLQSGVNLGAVFFMYYWALIVLTPASRLSWFSIMFSGFKLLKTSLNFFK